MRKEIFNNLKTITPNVFQDYPEQEKDFPCLVFSLTINAKSDHDGIGFFNCDLRVEIYAESSEERSDLELKLIRTLVEKGWEHNSNVELPHPDYYRQNLTFSTVR